jgi:hypothetical protein
MEPELKTCSPNISFRLMEANKTQKVRFIRTFTKLSPNKVKSAELKRTLTDLSQIEGWTVMFVIT